MRRCFPSLLSRGGRRMYLGFAAILAIVCALAFAPRIFSGGIANEVGNAVEPLAPKKATSRIDKVVVYPNSALVTREVEVPDGNGLIELIVNPMPSQIVASTMYSEGAEGLRVLTTRYATRVVAEDTSVERRKLEAEMEKYLVIGSKITSDIGTIQKNTELLTRVEGIAEKGEKRTGEEVLTIIKYVVEQRGERAKEMVEAMERKRVNDIQLTLLQRKMAELGQGSSRQEREAVIVVDRETGKGGHIRLNYLVSSVTWRPEYKVRAGKATEDVQVDYLANLTQNTGEDWNQCKITLSTAQPMLNATPPALAMLAPVLLHRGTGGVPPIAATAESPSPFINSVPSVTQASNAYSLRAQASSNLISGDSKMQWQAAKDINDAAAVEQNLDLQQSREEVIANLKKRPISADGPSVTFHLPRKLTIPSRHDEQIVEVVKLNLAPKFYYKTVPVLNRQVYRLADLVNKSEHVLLPGEATMYQGTDFVGRMPMPLVAVGEEFTAGFGVDTQLQIQRQMIDQTRTTQGGNQVLKYEYRILVSSYKNEPVKLQLWDRLPKSENESVIGVSLLKHEPKLSADELYLRESRPHNLLRWDLDVPANCNGAKALAITYEFRMELDRQMAITGFQSR